MFLKRENHIQIKPFNIRKSSAETSINQISSQKLVKFKRRVNVFQCNRSKSPLKPIENYPVNIPITKFNPAKPSMHLSRTSSTLNILMANNEKKAVIPIIKIKQINDVKKIEIFNDEGKKLELKNRDQQKKASSDKKFGLKYLLSNHFNKENKSNQNINNCNTSRSQSTICENSTFRSYRIQHKRTRQAKLNNFLLQHQPIKIENMSINDQDQLNNTSTNLSKNQCGSRVDKELGRLLSKVKSLGILNVKLDRNLYVGNLR